MAAALAARPAWLQLRSPMAHSFQARAQMPSAVAVAPGQRDNTAAASVLARAAALAAVAALMADRTLILEVGVVAADTAAAPEASSEQTMVVAVPEVQAVDPTE